MIDREHCLQVLRMYFSQHAQQYGITSMALFGSVARQEQTEDSDVDVLYQGAPNLLLRIRMKDELEDALGCSVDLIRQRDCFNGSAFAEDISKDLIYVS